MARLLYIKANPKANDQSLTFTLSDFFIKQYQLSHPNDTVEVLDLYQTIMPIMDCERLALYNQGKEIEIRHLAEQFKSFDKCVIAAPVWNHSFPAMLKIYLDNIVYRHVTFGYQDGKVAGLCSDMKVMYISTSGQPYSGNRSFLNHHVSQVEAVLSLVGITDVDSITLWGRNSFNEDQLKQQICLLQNQMVQKAKQF